MAPDSIPGPEMKTDHDYLIQISTSLSLGFKGVHEKLDDLCCRLTEVEKKTDCVADYGEFKDDVYRHFEKYDIACVKSEDCPARWERLEARVDVIEKCKATDQGKKDIFNNSLVQNLISGGIWALLVFMGILYLHVSGGKL